MVTLHLTADQSTIRAMSGPVTDQRAWACELLERYHRAFGGTELPVPVEAIAADPLGLYVEDGEIDCSGLLLPAERRVVVKAEEPPARRRFTLAHEVGHWVCQVLEGHAAPVYCRAADSRRAPTGRSSARRTSSPQSC
jgi:IrrE N-terminal-like domain